MKHFAGLDVSVKETSICIVDETGKICREMKVVSHPDDLAAVLSDASWNFVRVGLEAGPLSQWLFSGLAEHPAVWRCRGAANSDARTIASGAGSSLASCRDNRRAAAGCGGGKQ